MTTDTPGVALLLKVDAAAHEQLTTTNRYLQGGSPAVSTTTERLVPIEDLAARRALWDGVWDWLIREMDRLATEADDQRGGTTMEA